MKISFDLDDTLIPSNERTFPTIKRNFFQKLFHVEPLRVGSIELIRSLKTEGHEIGIYTTSYRSTFRIWFQFIMYGLTLSFIVNERINRRYLKKASKSASKFPPAFNIDLHIDDSPGVGKEGSELGFKTIIIDQEDMNWVSTVLDGLTSQ